MFGNVWLKSRFSAAVFVLLGMLMTSCMAPSDASAATMFCELAALPVLPLAADTGELLSPDELLDRVAESYRGLLEFGGGALLRESKMLENFFDPVPGRDQRSVALNESLTKLGDWVLLDADAHGLTQELILARLREVVRAHLGQAQEEQERAKETREERVDPGRETTTGHLFVRDVRFPKLGEAYRDPDGMVWGDVVRDDDGKVLKMNHKDALKHCQEIGAELPSWEDFARLREYMGAALGMRSEERAPGYSPQILPGLSSGWFWSSSVYPDDSRFAYRFLGGSGGFYYEDRDYYVLVRCVAR